MVRLPFLQREIIFMTFLPFYSGRQFLFQKRLIYKLFAHLFFSLKLKNGFSKTFPLKEKCSVGKERICSPEDKFIS